MEPSIIITLVVALVIIYVLFGMFRIVPENIRLVITQFGRFRATRGPGITFVMPIIEQVRARVDLREKFIDIPAQTAITRDNANIGIDFIVYYRIVDPMLSVFKVENVEQASVLLATTTLRAVIGDIELDDVLSKREEINHTLRQKLDEATERWGMKIIAVEIREIQPPKGIMDAMAQQMTAERQRRAEGERQSSIMIAEGEKQSSILKAQGDQESAILRAEGERQSMLLRAQGFAAGLQALQEHAAGLDEKTLLLQYLEALQKIGSSPSTKFIIPMELMTMAQQLSGSISTVLSKTDKQ